MRQVQTRRTLSTLFILGLLPLAGCIGTQSEMKAPEPAPAQATEAPAEATATPVSAAPALRLEAKGAAVSIAVDGAEARTLTDGESVDLAVGNTVAVGAGSSARLNIGDGADAGGELLPGSSVSLETVDDEGGLTLAQEAGTVRYQAAASALKVDATGLSIRGAADSDFVVSLSAKAPFWVGVASGSVEVQKASPVAMAASASASDTVTLTAGQAAAFDDSGKLLGQVDLPQAKLESWYDGMEAGKAAPMAQLAAPKSAAQPVAAAPAAPVAAPATASFNADATVVDAGACTTLHWSAPDALFVTLDGSDVVNVGSQQVCLSEPKTFKLSWVGKDGKELSSLLGISIRSVSTDGGDDDDEDVVAPPEPTPEPTECVGPECELPSDPGSGSGLEPGDPAPAEPPPAEPAPAEPAPSEPQPEPQPTP